MIISLIGMPGCGKTTIAKMLAKKSEFLFVDLDEYIEKNYGKIDELFKIGQSHFRDIETKALKECLKIKNSILATGGGVILKSENRQLLKNNCTTIFINRNIEDIINSTNFGNRPLLKNNISKIHELYNERIDKYFEVADYVLESNNNLKDSIKQLNIYLKEIISK